MGVNAELREERGMSRTVVLGGILLPIVALGTGALWWYGYIMAFPHTVVATGLFEPSPRLQRRIACSQWYPLSGHEPSEVRDCTLESKFHVLRFQQGRADGQSQPLLMPGSVRWNMRKGRVVAVTAVGATAAILGWMLLWRWLRRVDRTASCPSVRKARP